MLHTTFLRRFAELQTAFDALPFESEDGYPRAKSIPSGKWQQWGTSVQSLIRAVFGESSPHYVNFLNAYRECAGRDYEVKVMQGIFLSAKEDFEGGYLFNVELLVSGEVFGDFVSLARQALSIGHKDVAAVLACAALEDALKRYASSCGIDVTDKAMQEVINALKAGGHIAGAQRSLLDAMPRIRNAALHADWTKLSEPDVSSVIGFVEQFLLSKFSGG